MHEKPLPTMLMRPCAATAVVAGILVVTSGCATVYEGKFAFSDGWRKATVEEVASSTQLSGTAASDCREGASISQLRDNRFALVAYAESGHLRRRIVVLPLQPRIQAGNAVYIKLRSCSGEIALRADFAP